MNPISIQSQKQKPNIRTQWVRLPSPGFSSLQLSPILNRMTDTWHIGNPTVINKTHSKNFLTLFFCLILSLIDSSLQPLPFPTQKIKSSLFFYKNNKKFCTIIMTFVGGISFSSSSSFFSLVLSSLLPSFFP